MNLQANEIYHVQDGVLVKIENESEKVVIPAMVDGEMIHTIGLESPVFNSNVREKSAWAVVGKNTVVREIIIPEGVKRIARNAFEHCDSLESVKIPSSVTKIDPFAFASCPMLEDFLLPPHLEKIEEGAFLGCKTKQLVIPESVAELGARAFFACLHLKEVVIYNKDIELKGGVFQACHSLRRVFIPEGTPAFSRDAFEDSRYSAIQFLSTKMYTGVANDINVTIEDVKKGLIELPLVPELKTRDESVSCVKTAKKLVSATPERAPLKVSLKKFTFTFELAGTGQTKDCRLAVERLQMDDRVFWVPEEKNEYEKIAFAIKNAEGQLLGWVHWQLAAHLAILFQNNIIEIVGVKIKTLVKASELGAGKRNATLLIEATATYDENQYRLKVYRAGVNRGLPCFWEKQNGTPVDEFYYDKKLVVQADKEREGGEPLASYYDPPVITVKEIDVVGEETNHWIYTEELLGYEGKLMLLGYEGPESHIILPTFINGKKVFGFGCSKDNIRFDADIVEIPGSYEGYPSWKCFDSPRLDVLIVGEGVKEIGDIWSRHVYVCASKSVEIIDESICSHIRDYKKYEYADGFLIVGSKLVHYKGKSNIMRVPYGVTTIGKGVLGNSSVFKVILPETVTTLCKDAFYASSYEKGKVEEFEYTDSLIHVGKDALGGNVILDKFVNEPVIINNNLYQYVTNEETVVIPNGVTIIFPEVFKNNKKIKTVIMPDTLKKIGDDAFSGCSNLSMISVSSKTGVQGSAVFPETLVEVGRCAFEFCSKLEEVEMRGAETIGFCAFRNCTSLHTVKADKALKVLDTRAFDGCKSLQKIEIGEELEEIPAFAFNECSSIEEVMIPSAVQEIRINAFSECVNLKKIQLPQELLTIGKNAFLSCKKLENIKIPPTVIEIGDCAFMNCVELKTVEMKKQDIKLGESAFSNTAYEQNAPGGFFVSNGKLMGYRGEDKHITIPNDVKEIGEGAFKNASDIEVLTIPGHITSIPKSLMGTGGLWGNDTLKKVELENGVTHIMDSAFLSCRGMEELVFSETIEYIGKHAFSRIDFNVIELPKSVRKVERSAFFGTSELIVYDTIDPEAKKADEWKYDKWNGTVNSSLACAMLNLPENYIECEANTSWRSYHITVRSAETGEIKYRIYCDSEEREDYRVMMFSGWGKHGSFVFERYDEYFMKTRNALGRTEMAFCRIQYPYGLSEENKKNYEEYLKRCLYIERSAIRTAELVMGCDNLERLKLLAQYDTIDKHNIQWLLNVAKKCEAKNCLAFLEENYTKKGEV